MFVTIVLLYLAATTGLSITAWLLIATVLIDLMAWSSIQTGIEAWITGTTTSQEFWEEDE